MWSCSLLPQTMQVALVPLGLVSTQMPLISYSTHSAKLPLFQKAAAVIVIVDFVCICKTTGNGWRGRMHAPSLLLPKSSVQKGGEHIFGSLR